MKLKANLNNIEKYRYQNDSFKRWCNEHQGDYLKVINEDEKAYLFKGVHFWISKEFVE